MGLLLTATGALMLTVVDVEVPKIGAAKLSPPETSPKTPRSARHTPRGGAAPRAARRGAPSRGPKGGGFTAQVAWSPEVASRKTRSCTPGAATHRPVHTPVEKGAPGESRSASACGRPSPRLESLKPEPCRSTNGYVEPPWGARRANLDHPTWDEVVRRRQVYCEELDSQATANQDRKLQMQYEDKRMNMTTTTGWESRHHEWGSEAVDAVAERAVYKELLATADSKRRAAHLDRDAEHQEYIRLRSDGNDRFDRTMAEKQERAKQERSQLAETWRTAAASRQSRQEADRAGKLRAEQLAMNRMRDGMVPARRMKRSKDQCLHDRLATPL